MFSVRLLLCCAVWLCKGEQMNELISDAKIDAHPMVTMAYEEIGKVVVGQEQVIERVLISLLTGGHLLLEGVPGLAKTLLVQAMGNVLKLNYNRVQFTIDLLPSDILGSEILDQGRGTFVVNKGPIFCNLLLADEINRAAPKVQSALLEAMQERKVTIGTETFSLPLPFLVIATKNPVEHAGTFELPEAQLDRFMLRHQMTYPSDEEELDILARSLELGLKKEGNGAVPKTAFDLVSNEKKIGEQDLVDAMTQVQKVHVSDVFLQHVNDIVRKTREHEAVELGCSPRAGLALVHASRARAFLHAREHVIPDDIFALAEDALLHRIRLTYEALARRLTGEAVIQEILHSVY